jgi:type II secretory pathway pseudopilin PulG
MFNLSKFQLRLLIAGGITFSVLLCMICTGVFIFLLTRQPTDADSVLKEALHKYNNYQEIAGTMAGEIELTLNNPRGDVDQPVNSKSIKAISKETYSVDFTGDSPYYQTKTETTVDGTKSTTMLLSDGERYMIYINGRAYRYSAAEISDSEYAAYADFYRINTDREYNLKVTTESQYKYVATEEIAGIRVYKYEISYPQFMADDFMRYTAKAWLGPLGQLKLTDTAKISIGKPTGYFWVNPESKEIVKQSFNVTEANILVPGVLDLTFNSYNSENTIGEVK